MSNQTVLVIDDDKSVHAAVERRLGWIVDSVLHAELPGDGIRLATLRKPDVVLLDINLPGMDGYKVCRHLKENAATRDIQILFLTVDRKAKNIAKALDCGGSDYIMKPFNPVELEARVRVALRTKQTFDMLKEQARFDGLTGLKNRAALDDALTAATSAHERTGQPMGLLMIDLDYFKEINDTYGHGVGDEILREVGATIHSRCRPYDVACRFGGDEFTVILGGIDGDIAQQAARRILAGIDEVKVRAGRETVRVHGSGGLATSLLVEGGFSPAEILKVADSALYTAKRSGRGRLVIGGEQGSATAVPVPGA